MKLFKQNQSKLVEFTQTPFELERDIQSLIESNVSSLFNLQMVCSEFTIGSFRLDTLCFDEDSSAFVIIEYKKGNSYSVIDQGYSYLSTMLQNKADFILEYNEKTDKTLKKDQVDWSQSRVIFVSPSFNAYPRVHEAGFGRVKFAIHRSDLLDLAKIPGRNGLGDLANPTCCLAVFAACRNK